MSVRSDRLVPIETPPDVPIVKAACAAAGNKLPQGSATMSDMVFLAGMPAVKIGPGQSVRSHTRDEFIIDAELLDGAATYGEIIRSYFAAARRTLHSGSSKWRSMIRRVPLLACPAVMSGVVVWHCWTSQQLHPASTRYNTLILRHY